VESLCGPRTFDTYHGDCACRGFNPDYNYDWNVTWSMESTRYVMRKACRALPVASVSPAAAASGEARLSGVEPDKFTKHRLEPVNRQDLEPQGNLVPRRVPDLPSPGSMRNNLGIIRTHKHKIPNVIQPQNSARGGFYYACTAAAGQSTCQGPTVARTICYYARSIGWN